MHNRVAIFRQFSLTGGIVAEKKRGLKVKFGPSSRQHFPLSSLTQVADKVLSAVVSLTGKPATHLLQHPILSRPFVTTVRYCRQSKDNEGEPAERPEYPEKPEGQKGYVPKEVDWQTSVEYMNSTAYQKTYGNHKVWTQYRRNFKGQYPPETRKKCIRAGLVSTGSACPICRDDFLVLDYRNLKLLKQFLAEGSDEPLPTKTTGICQTQFKKLQLEIAKAVDHGYIETYIPVRDYNYDDYRKILEEKKAKQT